MKKIILYIILLGTLPVVGCKKFLEKLPDNRTEVATPEQVTMLLTTAYPHANYITFCEAMSDNAEDKGGSGAGYETDIINRQSYFFEDVQSKQMDSPEAYWDSCYKAVAAANQALQVINNAKDTAGFSAQKGEALLARAYAHFMLVTLYAKAYDPATAASDPGIPYVLTPENIVFQKYDRKTVSYVYDMIEKDLQQGLPLINDKIYGNAPKFHFTQKAAHAFATRFYLFKQDYASVIAHANEALSSTVTNDLRPWNTTYMTLQYANLQATYTKSTEAANILLQETNSLWGRSYASYRYGLGNTIFETVLTGPNVTGGVFAVGRNVYGSDPKFYNVPKFNEHFVQAGINADIGDPYNIIPLLTAEEVLFNRAEAYIRLHNYSAALSDLNAWVSQNVVNYNSAKHDLTQGKIQAFYGGSIESAMLNTVLDFKRAFFIHEGLRWFDILRLKLPVTHTTTDGRVIQLSADDKRKLLQLPAEVTLSGLPLNPR